MTFLHQTRSCVRLLEKLFLKWGQFVADNPYSILASAVAITAMCSLGIINLTQEHRPKKLWVPPDSSYSRQVAWLDKHFHSNDRLQVMLFTSDNVLTPDGLREMFHLHQSVNSIDIDGKKFKDICSKVAIADIFKTGRRRKRNSPGEYDIVTEYSPEGEYNYYYDINFFEDARIIRISAVRELNESQCANYFNFTARNLN